MNFELEHFTMMHKCPEIPGNYTYGRISALELDQITTMHKCPGIPGTDEWREFLCLNFELEHFTTMQKCPAFPGTSCDRAGAEVLVEA